MRALILVLLIVWPAVIRAGLGLNIPHATPTADLAPAIQYARDKGLTYVRFDVAIDSAAPAGVLLLEHYKRIGELCRKTGRVPVPLLASRVPNLSYWRSAVAPPGSEADRLEWENRKRLESEGVLNDWNAPAGIDPRYHELVILSYLAILREIAAGYGSCSFLVQIENEPGSVKNARLWPGYPYGYVSPAFRAWVSRLRPRIAALGVKLIAPQWEHESESGLLEQVFSGRSPETPLFDFEAVGFYEPWRDGDTPDLWAARKLAAWKRVYPVWRPHRPVIFTESGGFGIPRDKREACRLAENRLSWPGVVHRVWFAYSEAGFELTEP